MYIDTHDIYLYDIPVLPRYRYFAIDITSYKCI